MALLIVGKESVLAEAVNSVLTLNVFHWLLGNCCLCSCVLLHVTRILRFIGVAEIWHLHKRKLVIEVQNSAVCRAMKLSPGQSNFL